MKHLMLFENYEKANNAIYENKHSEEKIFKSDITRHEEDNSLIDVEYTFKIDKNEYKVVFSSKEKAREFDVSFGIDTGAFNKIDTFQMTGKGNARKVLKKVGETINFFYDQYKNEIDYIRISGTSEKRNNLYKNYIHQFVDKNAMSKIRV